MHSPDAYEGAYRRMACNEQPPIRIPREIVEHSADVDSIERSEPATRRVSAVAIVPCPSDFPRHTACARPN